MNKGRVTRFATAFKEETWRNFSKCIPKINSRSNTLSSVPEDVVSALISLIGEEQASEWINSELEDLDNMKAIELIKSEEGLKALKMFILSMPS